MLVFPEGTFMHTDGVRPFRLGAFRSAAEASCPIIPVAIRGARAMLRDGHVIPRRGPISLWIGEPIHAEGESFRDLVALRDRTRALVAEQSGEVVLDLVSAGWETGT